MNGNLHALGSFPEEIEIGQEVNGFGKELVR